MRRAVIWTLLIVFAWPVALIVWIVKYPDQAKNVWRTIRDHVRAHPALFLWGGFGLGVLGVIIGVTALDPGMTAFYCVWAAVFGSLLVRRQLKARAVAAAEIAARADAQHAAYLAGDDFGVYGTRDMPNI
ncbi:hypothetical protein [Nocardia cyriacigeorgica]|uniref:Uncharacterized protein n=1 Tax=Nocardia cyriacigeorgica TaxID=135487 RepID=A0A5R8NB95_9NOCA|nr:hypothetical protein [Nocardia cyriacigeorgica]TLF72906.1 hypothetical protein FEK34_28190 [Nocardia cyriacigeorgica]